jgi:hypothetical protein
MGLVKPLASLKPLVPDKLDKFGLGACGRFAGASEYIL